MGLKWVICFFFMGENKPSYHFGRTSQSHLNATRLVLCRAIKFAGENPLPNEQLHTNIVHNVGFRGYRLLVDYALSTEGLNCPSKLLPEALKEAFGQLRRDAEVGTTFCGYIGWLQLELQKKESPAKLHYELSLMDKQPYIKPPCRDGIPSPSQS